MEQVRRFADSEGSEVIVVSAQLEAEIAELDGEEKEEFLKDLGIEESGLDKLIKSSYSLLNLISYLTAGEPEVRAWTITKGTKAPQAAGRYILILRRALSGRRRSVTISWSSAEEIWAPRERKG